MTEKVTRCDLKNNEISEFFGNVVGGLRLRHRCCPVNLVKFLVALIICNPPTFTCSKLMIETLEKRF